MLLAKEVARPELIFQILDLSYEEMTLSNRQGNSKFQITDIKQFPIYNYQIVKRPRLLGFGILNFIVIWCLFVWYFPNVVRFE